MTLQFIIIQEQNKLKWKNKLIKINYRLQHDTYIKPHIKLIGIELKHAKGEGW